MKKVKNLVLRICRVRGFKYVVVALVAIVFIGFVDENSGWKHMKNRQYISELDEEINQYREQHLHDQAQIRQLDNDPKSIEKIARERYFMKTDDEDIFVLSDDDRSGSSFLTETETNSQSNETVE